MLFHQALELSPAARIDVDLMADVRDAGHELLGGVVPIHPCERGVHADVPPLGCGLEEAFHGVLDNAAVLFLSLPQGFLCALTLADVAVIDDDGLNARLGEKIGPGTLDPPP